MSKGRQKEVAAQGVAPSLSVQQNGQRHNPWSQAPLNTGCDLRKNTYLPQVPISLLMRWT